MYCTLVVGRKLWTASYIYLLSHSSSWVALGQSLALSLVQLTEARYSFLSFSDKGWDKNVANNNFFCVFIEFVYRLSPKDHRVVYSIKTHKQKHITK